MRGQDTRLGVPSKGDVLAWSEAQGRWVKVNVRYVRANPTVYPRWVACKDAGRDTSTADAGHSVQCSECGATHVLRYTDRAKTAVSLAGFDGWSVDSSRVRCPKCSTASTADEVKP